jgi:membrane protease YdiL (CAAX protease family)
MTYLSKVMTYGLLGFAIATLWIPGRVFWLPGGVNYWIIPFTLSLGFGLSAGFVHPVALCSITLFGWACYSFSIQSSHGVVRTLMGILIGLFSIGLMTHGVPGFSNPIVIAAVVLSPGAIPYTQYVNFDKALIGLCLLAFGHPLLTTRARWITMLKTVIPLAATLIGVVMTLALLLGYVHFAMKWPAYFYLWAWNNLLFTCTAEEAFFRGFLQRHLQGSPVRSGYRSILGLALASLLFGLAHYAGGLSYIVLATIAGL